MKIGLVVVINPTSEKLSIVVIDHNLYVINLEKVIL